VEEPLAVLLAMDAARTQREDGELGGPTYEEQVQSEALLSTEPPDLAKLGRGARHSRRRA
jgi:hypothetical protein